MASVPLAVDLDGTLVLTDTLHEAALRALRQHPLSLLQWPLWLLRGKAHLKQNIAALSCFDASSLPYNPPFLAWLKTERANGRSLVLCTAADQSIANGVANHLGMFDAVMASDGQTNLSSENKADALSQRYGVAGFDYAGNAPADMAVWQQARHAIVVNASASLSRTAHATVKVEREFAAPSGSAWLRTLRTHQWMKNLLLLIAPAAAHLAPSFELLGLMLMAFLAFSLCASAVYIINDLFDLDSDRRHPRKYTRPFASGRVPILQGVALVPLLLLLAATLSFQVGLQFSAWLLLYFALTCAYSFGLKRLIIIDCLVLAMLYTLRIIAGAQAADIPLSFWLLAFSVFLFLSLAFVKRYAELEAQALVGNDTAHGRGYRINDAPLLQSLGITSGYASVLVLALYLNSEAVLRLYSAPAFMWCAVPVMLFWISWVWMCAHRGQMHDDPLLFAVRDKASLLAGLAFALVLVIGSLGWAW
jgi:4-hydroxybenzoate polyprenyltransferase